jgi:hypothetical protein
VVFEDDDRKLFGAFRMVKVNFDLLKMLTFFEHVTKTTLSLEEQHKYDDDTVCELLLDYSFLTIPNLYKMYRDSNYNWTTVMAALSSGKDRIEEKDVSENGV